MGSPYTSIRDRKKNRKGGKKGKNQPKAQTEQKVENPVAAAIKAVAEEISDPFAELENLIIEVESEEILKSLEAEEAKIATKAENFLNQEMKARNLETEISDKIEKIKKAREMAKSGKIPARVIEAGQKVIDDLKKKHHQIVKDLGPIKGRLFGELRQLAKKDWEYTPETACKSIVSFIEAHASQARKEITKLKNLCKKFPESKELQKKLTEAEKFAWTDFQFKQAIISAKAGFRAGQKLVKKENLQSECERKLEALDEQIKTAYTAKAKASLEYAIMHYERDDFESCLSNINDGFNEVNRRREVLKRSTGGKRR